MTLDDSSSDSGSSSDYSSSGDTSGGGDGSGSGDFQLVSQCSSGFACQGVIQVGSDDESDSVPGIYFEAAGATDRSYPGWDTNFSDGFDTNWRSIDLFVDLTEDGTNAGLNTDAPADKPDVGVSVSGVSNITKVQIAAEVDDAEMRSQFIGIAVTFSNADDVTEYIELPASVTPDANTEGGSSGGASQVVEVTPSRSDFTRVSVGASVRLSSTLTTKPGPTSLCARVLVFAS